MIMLAGIYYGAKYGGSTTSILLNVPGESASVVTCLDGYPMARKGRAGAALGIAAIASFIAGTVGVVGLMLVAPPLAKVALAFSRRSISRSWRSAWRWWCCSRGDSMLKALLAMLVGLWISGIGTDPFSPTSRFTFGRRSCSRASTSWWSRSACSRSARCWRHGGRARRALPVPKGLRNLLPTLQDLKDCRFAFVKARCSAS